MDEKKRTKRIEQLKREIQMHQNKINQAQNATQNEQKQLIAKLGILEEYETKGWEKTDKVSTKSRTR